jgi:hypothetical protein
VDEGITIEAAENGSGKDGRDEAEIMPGSLNFSRKVTILIIYE